MKNASMIEQSPRRGLRMVLFACLILTGIFRAGAQQPGSRDLAGAGGGQGPLQKVITLRHQQTGLIQLLTEIEQQARVRFIYNTQQLEKVVVPSVSLQKKTVAEALRSLLPPYGLGYRLDAGNIVIVPKPLPPVGKTSGPVTFSGQVLDAVTGTPLAGVTVVIKGAGRAVVTGDNGNFTIVAPDDKAVLEVTSTGYEKKEIRADNGGMPVFMPRKVQSMEGVTVQARRKVNTEAALLNDRKNAAVVSDGISAQQIERTASITTTQALQRVSGVTITDDKYVAVRGLGDRSVIGELNGIRLASSDPDRSTIPLDLVPANLLDNIVVYKTSSPDRPADASGGIVELKTKSIPTGKTLSITAQTGFNSNIGIGGKVNSFYNSDMGFLGDKVKDHDLKPDFINLGKQYPGGLGQIQQFVIGANNDPVLSTEVNRINGIMHEFAPVLTTRYKQAPLNGIYSVTFGNSYKVFGHHQLGVILSGSYYNRSTDITNGVLNQYSIYQGVMTGNPLIDESRVLPAYITPNTPNLGRYVNYKENTGDQILNYGILGGLSYRFDPNNEISFQYLGSRGAETQATNLTGQYDYTSGLTGPVYSYVYSLKQTYRTFNTYNLQGEHKFGNGKHAPRLSYNGASSKSTQDDPDYRFVNLADYRPKGGGFVQVPSPTNDGYLGVTDYYALVSGYVNGYGPYGKIQADPNGRRFRNLTETNYNYKVDLTLPFGFRGLDQFFKAGYAYLFRDRTFGEYVLSLPGSNFSATKQLPLYETYGDLDQLVGYNQIGIHPAGSSTPEGAPLVNGFLYNSQKSPNNYKGFYETNAFYGMLDLHPIKDLRLNGGVRFEKTNIQSRVDTSNIYIDPSLTEGGVNLVYINPVSKYITKYKPYYSANLTYTLNQQMNFRLAYSTSLARPEIRELTNVFEFDPFQQALIVGNPNLINQETKSYDFRWEWFPHTGEVLSASVFSKEIDHQLEKVFIQNSDGIGATYPEFPTVEYRNDPNKGHLWGIELELVKDLGLLWAPLHHFFIGSNASIVRSSIIKNEERLNAARIVDREAPSKSPLFEQAPYSINVFLNYTNTRTGTDLTATFNMVGERLVQVNLDGSPDLYSRPMPVLDFVFSQKITKRLLFKGYAKNVLNRPYQENYTSQQTGGTYYGTKYVRRSIKKGAEIMVGLTYDLF